MFVSFTCSRIYSNSSNISWKHLSISFKILFHFYIHEVYFVKFNNRPSSTNNISNTNLFHSKKLLLLWKRGNQPRLPYGHFINSVEQNASGKTPKNLTFMHFFLFLVKLQPNYIRLNCSANSCCVYGIFFFPLFFFYWLILIK